MKKHKLQTKAVIAKDWCLQCLRHFITYRKRSHACLPCSSCLCGHRTSWTQGAHIHASMTWQLQLSQIRCRPSRKVLSDLLHSLPLCRSNAAPSAGMPFYTVCQLSRQLTSGLTECHRNCIQACLQTNCDAVCDAACAVSSQARISPVYTMQGYQSSCCCRA